jgi:hypothetical protein
VASFRKGLVWTLAITFSETFLNIMYGVHTALGADVYVAQVEFPQQLSTIEPFSKYSSNGLWENINFLDLRV